MKNINKSESKTVSVPITPTMEKALRSFGSLYDENREERTLENYASWMLKTGLMMLPQIDLRLQAFCYYRVEEALNEAQFAEAEILKSLSEFQAHYQAKRKR